MAVSTYTLKKIYNPFFLGAARGVDCTITSDQVIKLNTHGRTYYLQAVNSSGGTDIFIRNTAGVSLSTVTDAVIWTGAGATGTQCLTALTMSGTSDAPKSASVPSATRTTPLTATSLYFSCASTTATAGAVVTIYIFGTVDSYI